MTILIWTLVLATVVALVLMVPSFAAIMGAIALFLMLLCFAVAVRGLFVYAGWWLIDFVFPQIPDPNLFHAIILGLAWALLFGGITYNKKEK